MERGFIIDTNKYSGNFERELCAFVTGHIGDCGVGEKEALEYQSEFSMIPGVKQVDDEDQTSIYRPVSIYPTEDVWNNGLGFHFQDGEEEQALLEYRKYTQEYYGKLIERVEGHRGKNIQSWTDATIDREIVRYTDTINKAMSQAEVAKYPAYQSVIIYFDALPKKETIEFMKERAYQFGKINDIHITGFRFQ